jgi:hypothetical protein
MTVHSQSAHRLGRQDTLPCTIPTYTVFIYLHDDVIRAAEGQILTLIVVQSRWLFRIREADDADC